MFFSESVETTFSASFPLPADDGRLQWHGHNLTLRTNFEGLPSQAGVILPAGWVDQAQLAATQSASTTVPAVPPALHIEPAAHVLLQRLSSALPAGVRLARLSLSHPDAGLVLEGARTLYTFPGYFSAAHRTHAPRLSDLENQALYGICDNPAGHGHNYRAAVWHPSSAAVTPTLWAEFDHRNLSVDIPDLLGRNVVTEAIAALIARRAPGAARVRVWETRDFYAEYLPALEVYRLGRRYHFSAVHQLSPDTPGSAEAMGLSGHCGPPGIHGHDFSVTVLVTSALDPRTEAAFDLGLLDRLAGSVLAPLRRANLSADLPELSARPATTLHLSTFVFEALNRELGAVLCAVGVSAWPRQMSWTFRGDHG
jgi:6-pyruvoyltetrahydropterin/6-carboxytetrahydropterin synthase